MGGESVDSESKVSGNQTNIPAQIRQELDIDDGDKLRWQIEDDGTLLVQVVPQQSGTFGDFDGYDGGRSTEVESEHDAWGVDEQGRLSVDDVEQRYGAFDDLEPVDVDVETDAAEDHDLTPGDR